MIEVELDGEKISSWEMLHDRLAVELGFPAWYGGNLDALYDCLTDIHEDTVLVISHREQLTDNLGDNGESLYRVLRRAQRENQRFRVDYEKI